MNWQGRRLFEPAERIEIKVATSHASKPPSIKFSLKGNPRMKAKLTLTLTSFAGLILIVSQILGTSSQAAVPLEDLTNPHYKGGSTFAPVLVQT